MDTLIVVALIGLAGTVVTGFFTLLGIWLVRRRKTEIIPEPTPETIPIDKQKEITTMQENQTNVLRPSNLPTENLHFAGRGEILTRLSETFFGVNSYLNSAR